MQYKIKSSAAINKDMIFRISGASDLSEYERTPGRILGVFHQDGKSIVDVFYTWDQGQRASFTFEGEPLWQLLSAEEKFRGLEKRTVDILTNDEGMVEVLGIPDASDSYRRA